MQKGNKIAIIGFLIFGIALIPLGCFIPSTYTEYHSYSQIANVQLIGNILLMMGVLIIAGTSIALVASRYNLNKTYQGSISLIFLGIIFSAFSHVKTFDSYGYEYSITTFPLSFIGYPLLALGFGILLYSYFTNHLRLEIVQTSEENKTVSTAKVVWKEDSTKPKTNQAIAPKESVHEQLMKQHMTYDVDETAPSENQQTIRYCRYCGSKNKTDAVFCERCGKQF